MPTPLPARAAFAAFVLWIAAVTCTASPTHAASHTFTSNTTLGAADFTYESYDIVVQNCILTVEGQHAFHSLRLEGLGRLTHLPGDSLGISLSIADTLLVPSGTIVEASGLGYAPGTGPGAGTGSATTAGGGGGGAGGRGGDAASGALTGGNSTGSLVTPSTMGSGGGSSLYGSGGTGGGRIRLIVGTCVVDGFILAGGSPGSFLSTGGGAGGSIWIDATRFAGAGSVSAGGGPATGNGGGGGGGRIAVSYAQTTFSGSMTACGGTGTSASFTGGAGTIYTFDTTTASGLVHVSNCDSTGATTDLVGGDLAVPGRLIVDHKAQLAAPPQDTLSLQVLGSLTIAAGSSITMNGRGHLPASGPGAGGSGATAAGGGGGGHAGNGGDNNALGGLAGATYGDPVSGLQMGSGGGASLYGNGGNGGGFILLAVQDSLVLDGSITATGALAPNLASGGGAGGAVWLSAGVVSGAGLVDASGGAGSGNGGGGGGGRISAIYGSASGFTGTLTVCGGGATAATRGGGGGTIATRALSDPRATIRFANCGIAQSVSELPAAATWDANLVVEKQANLSTRAQQPLSVTLTGSLTVAADGVVSADGRGYPGGQGVGAGGSSLAADGGAGGGYGGNGGANSSGAAPGGATYGDATAAGGLGSGGGTSLYGAGGAGGGAIAFSVTGSATVAGVIRALGSPSTALSSGAGSGGSIVLTAASLAGNGSFSANGGAGANNGGGGGGGRIVVTAPVSTFTGSLTACGGAAVVATRGGGAGSTCTTLGTGVRGRVTYSNCGALQSRSDIPAGAWVWDKDLTVSGNAQVSTPALVPMTITLTGGLTVASDGIVTATGRGYAGGTGPGAGGGTVTTAGGAGGSHGGTGGTNSNATAVAGTTYDDIFAPADFGSGGGSSLYGPGAAGGGRIALSVGGTVRIDGSLECNGNGTTALSEGAGSGGTIAVSADSLVGGGSVSAAGGTASGNGGAGGGGRVALTLARGNAFSGTVRACPGGGGSTSIRGGAGTGYIRVLAPAVQPRGEVTVDGCGTITLARTDLPSGGPLVWASNLRVRNNGVLSARAGSPLALDVQGNVVVESTGAIDVGGRGFVGGSGPGVGATELSAGGGGGAGYGGSGGASNGGLLGGHIYGSPSAPKDLGSGGALSLYGLGGSGGGAIDLVVTDTLRLDGRLAADGNPTFALSSGAGSGGSIYARGGVLLGSGTVTARGGLGSGNGGSGGGGRVHLVACLSSATLTFDVSGGGGTRPGYGGTLYPAGSGIETYCVPLTGVDEPEDGGAPPVVVDRLALSARPARGGRGGAEFTLALPHGGPVRLEVLDIAGRRIATPLDGALGRGVHRLAWDGRDGAGRQLAAGVRLARVTTPEGVVTSRLLLLR